MAEDSAPPPRRAAAPSRRSSGGCWRCPRTPSVPNSLRVILDSPAVTACHRRSACRVSAISCTRRICTPCASAGQRHGERSRRPGPSASAAPADRADEAACATRPAAPGSPARGTATARAAAPGCAAASCRSRCRDRRTIRSRGDARRLGRRDAAPQAVVDVEQHVVVARVGLHRLGRALRVHQADRHARPRPRRRAIAGSKASAETSLTISAPGRQRRLGHRAPCGCRSRSARRCRPRGAPRSPAATRAISSGSGTSAAPGRVLSPPMSRMSAPVRHQSRGRAPAPPRRRDSRPPSEKLSGVTFRMPMIRGRSSDSPQTGGARRVSRCAPRLGQVGRGQHVGARRRAQQLDLGEPAPAAGQRQRAARAADRRAVGPGTVMSVQPMRGSGSGSAGASGSARLGVAARGRHRPRSISRRAAICSANHAASADGVARAGRAAVDRVQHDLGRRPDAPVWPCRIAQSSSVRVPTTTQRAVARGQHPGVLLDRQQVDPPLRQPRPPLRRAARRAGPRTGSPARPPAASRVEPAATGPARRCAAFDRSTTSGCGAVAAGSRRRASARRRGRARSRPPARRARGRASRSARRPASPAARPGCAPPPLGQRLQQVQPLGGQLGRDRLGQRS